MSASLLAIVTLFYLGAAAAYGFEGKPGFSVTFLGYALANLGIIYEGMK